MLKLKINNDVIHALDKKGLFDELVRLKYLRLNILWDKYEIDRGEIPIHEYEYDGKKHYFHRGTLPTSICPCLMKDVTMDSIKVAAIEKIFKIK